MTVARVSLPALGLLLLLPACRKPVVESYRVAKDTKADPAKSDATAASTASTAAPAPTLPGNLPGGAPMAGTPVATASGAGLTWSAPSHWSRGVTNHPPVSTLFTSAPALAMSILPA